MSDYFMHTYVQCEMRTDLMRRVLSVVAVMVAKQMPITGVTFEAMSLPATE